MSSDISEPTQSPTLAKLFAALAAAQGEMEAASKDKTNPFYNSKYADLASCWDACRGPLSRHELSVVQLPSAVSERLETPIVIPASNDEKKPRTIHFVQHVTVTTILGHSSGEWISSRLTGLAIGDTAQDLLKCTTYLRRGGLCPIAGVAPEDDDDGESASAGADREKPEIKPDCQTCKTNKHVIKGKEEFGGGWVCYKAKGGCGKKWHDEEPSESPSGEVIERQKEEHAKIKIFISTCTVPEKLTSLRAKLPDYPLAISQINDLTRDIDARLYSIRSPDEQLTQPDPEESATARGEHSTAIQNCEGKDTLLTRIRESIADDKRLIDADRAALTDLLLKRAAVLDTGDKKTARDWGEWQNAQESNFRKKIKTAAQRSSATSKLLDSGAPAEVVEYLVTVLDEIAAELSRNEPAHA